MKTDSQTTKAAPAPGVFTLPQVATMLAVSKRTLEREVQRGRLRIVRIGRCVRVKADDLAAYSSSLTPATK